VDTRAGLDIVAKMEVPALARDQTSVVLSVD